MKALKEEYAYFKDHQHELAKVYRDKVLVIVADEVVGVFDSEVEAFNATKRKYPLGTFLIQHCPAGKVSYSETYHSRDADG